MISPCLGNLRYLNLHGCLDSVLKNEEAIAQFYSLFPSPPKLPNLTHLVLSNCSWVCDAFLLLYLPLLPNLEFLNLKYDNSFYVFIYPSATRITDSSLTYISLVPSLEVLHIASTVVSASAISKMVAETKVLLFMFFLPPETAVAQYIELFIDSVGNQANRIEMPKPVYSANGRTSREISNQ